MPEKMNELGPSIRVMSPICGSQRSRAQRVLRAFLRSFFFGALMLAAGSACKRGEGSSAATAPTPTPGRPVTIKIVHTPQFAQPLRKLSQDFLAGHPLLADHSRVDIELVPQATELDASEHIANGEVKVQAWVTSDLSYVNLSNSTRINLGPPQVDCQPLFSTTPVLAVSGESAQALTGDAKRSVSLRRLLLSQKERTSAAAEAVENGRGQPLLLLAHSDPLSNQAGLAALIQLAYTASPDGSLNSASLKTQTLVAQLREYENGLVSYPSNEDDLLSWAAHPTSDQLRVALTNQSSVYRYNQAHQDTPLVSITLEEGVYTQFGQICTSQADWVTPAHGAALKLFVNYLKEPGSLRSFESEGYQLPLPDQTRRQFEELNGATLKALLKNWPNVKKPQANIYVIDTSGSMSGDPMEAVKNEMRKVFSLDNERGHKALLSFSSEVDRHSGLVKNALDLIPALDTLQGAGGSAIYDSLMAALQLTRDPALKDELKHIFLLTDGSDRSSIMSLSYLLSELKRASKSGDFSLEILAINYPGTDLNDLKQIAAAADGRFRTTALIDLDQAFAKIGKED